jgi:hypothetical protein
MSEIKKVRFSWFFILLVAFGMGFSCKSKSSYPCPNTKNSSKRSAQVNDEEGAAPSSKNGKSSKKNNGLVKRKEPKRIHRK